jgi:hypothetical protein
LGKGTAPFRTIEIELDELLFMGRMDEREVWGGAMRQFDKGAHRVIICVHAVMISLK